MKYFFSEWLVIQSAIKGRPLALFLDFDGTLSPIAPEPTGAFLPASTRELVRALAVKENWKVAVVSGRSLKDVKSLVGIEGLVYSGNHGLEIEGPDISFESLVPEPMLAAMRTIAAFLKDNLPRIPGVFLEDKYYSISVHYRMVSEEKIARLKTIILRATAAGQGQGLIKLRRGKKVHEILPQVDWDKGKAIQWLLTSWDSSKSQDLVPICLGDDLTDEDAFRALQQDGLTIRVGKSISSEAKYFLKDIDDVIKLLKLLQTL